MTSNLTKTAIFSTFYDLNRNLDLKAKRPYVINHTLSLHSVKYFTPLSILSFAFQKRTYDTFMFFVFFILVNNYTSPKNFFKLYYSFI